MSIYLKLNLAKAGKLTPDLVQVLSTTDSITRTKDSCMLYQWSITSFYTRLETEQLYTLHEFIDNNLHASRFLNLANDDSQEVIGYLPLNIAILE